MVARTWTWSYKCKSGKQIQFTINASNECLQLTYACFMSVTFTNPGYSVPSYPRQIYFPRHVSEFNSDFFLSSSLTAAV